MFWRLVICVEVVPLHSRQKSGPKKGRPGDDWGALRCHGHVALVGTIRCNKPELPSQISMLLLIIDISQAVIKHKKLTFTTMLSSYLMPQRYVWLSSFFMYNLLLWTNVCSGWRTRAHKHKHRHARTHARTHGVFSKNRLQNSGIEHLEMVMTGIKRIKMKLP